MWKARWEKVLVSVTMILQLAGAISQGLAWMQRKPETPVSASRRAPS